MPVRHSSANSRMRRFAHGYLAPHRYVFQWDPAPLHAIELTHNLAVIVVVYPLCAYQDTKKPPLSRISYGDDGDILYLNTIGNVLLICVGMERKVTFTEKKEVFEFGTVAKIDDNGSFKRFLDWPLVSHHFDKLSYSSMISDEHQALSSQIIGNLQRGEALPDGIYDRYM